MRRLYEWVLSLAASPRALPALVLVTFAESMIFPIPPDVMLIPMCVARPERALRYAALMSIASVLGGIAGYGLGLYAWDQVGPWFFAHVPGFSEARFLQAAAWYDEYNFVVVFAAGFTPIPYKIITISAGVFHIAFPMFVVASAVSRSARFFLVAGLLRRYGASAQVFIDKHFNWLALAFTVLLVGGFLLLGLL